MKTRLARISLHLAAVGYTVKCGRWPNVGYALRGIMREVKGV